MAYTLYLFSLYVNKYDVRLANFIGVRFFSLCAVFLFMLACDPNSRKVDCSVSTLDFSTSVTNADCGQENGSIEVTASGGELPYLFSIADGITQSTSVFTGLPAGNYVVSVVDNTMCSKTEEVAIGNKGGFQATAALTDAGCKMTNGSINVQPVGGFAPYEYRLNGGSSQSSGEFADLSSGTYEVVITDATNCSFSLIEDILNGTSYFATIKPIIANSCATTHCHDGSSSLINLSNYSNVHSAASAIKSRTQSGNMPPSGSLSQAEKDAIACWVDDGALNN